jgi:malonyl-CoA/methylmalonyl-CoA synthetase
MQGLVQAWRWSRRDTILHTLPLHHIHGIVNALYCPAYVGATITFMPKFSASEVWKEIMVRVELTSDLVQGIKK